MQVQPSLGNISDSEVREYHAQITSAIQESELLTKQIASLRVSGKLREIRVMRSTELPPPKGKTFGAFAEGSSILVSLEFLQTSRKTRLYDVVYDDDIPPNHTVFALAHLAHHLDTQDRLPANKGPQSIESFVNAKLEDEAAAWIQGWNFMIEAATKRNGGKTLSPRQAIQSLMNFRYRHVLFRAMKVGVPANQVSNALELTSSGTFEPNTRNIQAIVSALKVSNMPDFE